MQCSISSHRNYGKRMALSFNEEIQSGYYQNTSVSVEGASLEWVDVDSTTRHTCYFGHWSDDSKQDSATTIRNMRDARALCQRRPARSLVEGQSCGGTVWKGTDGRTDIVLHAVCPACRVVRCLLPGGTVGYPAQPGLTWRNPRLG